MIRRSGPVIFAPVKDGFVITLRNEAMGTLSTKDLSVIEGAVNDFEGKRDDGRQFVMVNQRPWPLRDARNLALCFIRHQEQK